MSTAQLNKFAEELKTAREDCNLSLQMLNQKTRIDIKFLQAIEDGDFHIIDQVYIRAFIKAYAKNVGLDEDTTLKKYSLSKEGKYVDESPPEPESKDETTDGEKKVVFTSEYVKAPVANSNNSKKIDKRFIILGAVLIAITAIVYFVFLTDKSNTIVKEKSTVTRIEPELEDTEPVRFEIIKPDTTTKQVQILESDSLNLRITAIARTWIRALIDGTDQTEFTLNPDEAKVISAQSKFKLLIGNAGGVALEMNGKDLQLQGEVGDIKSVEIDSTGIRYLRINAESSNDGN